VQVLYLIVTFRIPGYFPPDWNFVSSIRGLFGRSLKNTFCLQRNIECSDCLFETCLYEKIFEPRTREYENYRPYIISQQKIDPPLVEIQFKFFGNIIENIIPILHSILKMQNYRMKILNEWYPLEIISIHSNDGDVVFQAVEHAVYPPTGKTVKLQNTNVVEMEINFLTPLRLKYQNRLMKNFHWPSFYRNLTRRIQYLFHYYGGNSDQLPEPDLSSSPTVSTEMMWQEFYRRSHRQHQKMSLGGLVGKVKLSDLQPTMVTYLKLGEIFQVGKQTTFGLGNYKITTGKRENNEPD